MSIVHVPVSWEERDIDSCDDWVIVTHMSRGHTWLFSTVTIPLSTVSICGGLVTPHERSLRILLDNVRPDEVPEIVWAEVLEHVGIMEGQNVH